MELRDAVFPQDLELVTQLFREYQESLGVDLSFQGFEAEVAGLPGKYSPPAGAVLLAEELGCVAMRPLADGICEMKRLYLRPESRGRGVGRALVTAIVERARAAGYRAMRLDTLPTMSTAQALYREFGFREIEPYCENPIAGTVFLELALF